jgi:hypothetical protein
MGKRLAIAIYGLTNLMTFVAGQEFLPHLAAEKASTIFLFLTFTATLVHEVGHAIAVAALGARIRVIAVWDLGYNFESGRFGVQKYRGSREVAGYVRYALNDLATSSHDHAWIAAAGPAANFFTAATAIGFHLFGPASILSGAAAMFAILSVGQAIANLTPFSGSDGSAIWAVISKQHANKS